MAEGNEAKASDGQLGLLPAVGEAHLFGYGSTIRVIRKSLWHAFRGQCGKFEGIYKI